MSVYNCLPCLWMYSSTDMHLGYTSLRVHIQGLPTVHLFIHLSNTYFLCTYHTVLNAGKSAVNNMNTAPALMGCQSNTVVFQPWVLTIIKGGT